MGAPVGTCETCEHEHESIGESACAGCGGGFSNWKPKYAEQLAAKDAHITKLVAENNALRNGVAAIFEFSYRPSISTLRALADKILADAGRAGEVVKQEKRKRHEADT